MNEVKIVKSAYNKLSIDNTKVNVIAGLDGFIDDITTAIDIRYGENNYKAFTTIDDFGSRIKQAAGKSCSIELISNKQKLGGNGPIMANALISQGYALSYIGAIGKNIIHPIFKSFANSCKHVFSIANPGYTQALEFTDGKVMLGKVDNLSDVNINNLLKEVKQEKLNSIICDAKLVAFTNWTMITNTNQFLTYFAKVNPNITIFVDLADPKRREKQDIKEVLLLLSKLNCKVVLGLNEGESERIADVLDINENDLLARASKIQKKLAIYLVVIHPVKNAVCAGFNSAYKIKGPYCKNPKLSTGAGDNFNSGFVNGLLQGLSFNECLAVGVCTSGYYVRNAKSPNFTQLVQFMKDWSNVNCEEI